MIRVRRFHHRSTALANLLGTGAKIVHPSVRQQPAFLRTLPAGNKRAAHRATGVIDTWPRAFAVADIPAKHAFRIEPGPTPFTTIG
jgi:hypothetical protein